MNTSCSVLPRSVTSPTSAPAPSTSPAPPADPRRGSRPAPSERGRRRSRASPARRAAGQGARRRTSTVRASPSVAQQLVERAGRDDRAVVDDDDALAALLGFLEMMRRQDDRDARLRAAPRASRRCARGSADRRRPSARRAARASAVQQAARDVQPPLHAAGEPLRRLVGAILRSDHSSAQSTRACQVGSRRRRTACRRLRGSRAR